MNAIEIQNLTKQYGNVLGVEDLSFSISTGEVFGYLGPNGSGKTTTIRCLMGLLRPTSGYCSIFGKQVVPGLATQHPKIGYLPGNFHIWPGRSARKSLELMSKLGNGANVKKRRQELAERLEINLDRKVGTLSKGNHQKVGIINAFQHNPDLYILDEPTIGLDPLIRMVVMDLIREVTKQGATVLLSSHDLSEVVSVCKCAAILRDGHLVELAPISQIVHSGKRQLKVWFIQEKLAALDNIEPPEDVTIIHRNENSLLLSYNGQADRVIKWLSGFPVERISIPETSIEQAFIQYYQKEVQNGN